MRALVIITAVVAFAAGSAATAATGWRVFATANDQGEFSTFASANAKVLAPKALALRTSGPVNTVSWFLTCQGETKTTKAGISLVAVNTADTCDLSGTVTGDEGKVRLQLLKR